MSPIVITSLTVSLIAVSVIFTVLVILIYTIKLLVRLIPYEEPPATAIAKARTSVNTVTPDIISAITATMAMHLKKSPQEFHITQINPK
jgi:Na+-transporting methylmalonyl-CoA/oxaloacetate decarboxylase gamma subunit